jgi:hypothetical protein
MIFTNMNRKGEELWPLLDVSNPPLGLIPWKRLGNFVHL